MQITYLDASVIVAWALESDPKHEAAKRIKEKINRGSIIAAISTLVLMEVIDAIRKRIPEHYKDDDSNPNVDDSLRKEIVRVEAELLDGITTLVGQNKLIWDDPKISIDKLLSEGWSLLRNSFGSLGQSTECKACRQPLLAKRRYYRGIGQYDVQHAIIAREMKAKELITFDKGFQDIGTTPRFRTLKVTIEHW
jgi:predicted nucleic acid-binding protein